MKHLFIRLQLDKSPIPQHVHAGTVAIHHILDRKCRVKDTECFMSGCKGHFSKVCRSKISNQQTSIAMFPTLAMFQTLTSTQ